MVWILAEPQTHCNPWGKASVATDALPHPCTANALRADRCVWIVSNSIDTARAFGYLDRVGLKEVLSHMATRFQGTPEEVLALDTYIKLSRAAESIDSRLLHQHTLDDLTITQFGVLEVLYHLGSLSQTNIGAKLLKSGGNITLVIDNLEKYGYVRRRRCDSDRRIIWIDLTDEGRARIEAVLPVHVAAIVAEMSILSADEQVELGRLLRKVGKGGNEESVNYADGAFDFEI